VTDVTRPAYVVTRATEEGRRPLERVLRASEQARRPSAPVLWATDLARSAGGFVREPMLPLIALAAFCSIVHAGAPMHALSALALLMLPGATLLALLGVRPGDSAMRIAAALSTGVIAVMVIGLTSSVVGPLLGLERPLERVPVLALMGTVTTAGAFVASRAGREPIRFVLGGLHPDWRVALPMALPVLAIIGVGRLNAGNGPAVAMIAAAAAFVVLVGLLVVTVRRVVSPDAIALVLFCATLSFAWATSLRGGHLFGWDIQQEYGSLTTALQRGRWAPPTVSDPYGAMASVTVLPAMLSSAAGIAPNDVLRWLMPIFTAILPVATFSLARRRAGSGAALAATLLLVGLQATTLRLLNAITRQEIAFAVFAIGLAVAFDPVIPLKRRRLFLAASVAALAIAHYSTAYVACVVLIGTWCISRAILPRGSRATSVVTLSVVAVALVAAAGWNVVLTQSSDNLSRLGSELQANGLNLLPGVPDQGLVAGWIEGTALPPLDPHAYQGIVDDRLSSSLTWLTPDPSSSSTRYALGPASVASDPPLAAEASGSWAKSKAISAQLLVFASFGTVMAALGFLVSRRRSKTPPDRALVELVSAGAAVLGVIVILRISGTIADLYNPERAAIQAGIILAPLIAIVIERAVRHASA